MFRFTIRELVLLTLVVAMGVAWWVDRRRLAQQVSTLEIHRDWVPIISPFAPVPSV